MDYTFGFDAKELARYGAKAVVFDAIRENYKGVRIHPYVKVSPDADPKKAQTEACKESDAKYFVVRASSRYEFLPGTAGMTNSERFVHYSQIDQTVQAVRQPTDAYRTFVMTNDLEPEKVMPVVVQPMWAGSFGIVTMHPNQRMTMVDYFEDDDSKERFGEHSFSFFDTDESTNLERRMAQYDKLASCTQLRRGTKFYARYRENGSVYGYTSDNTRDYRHLMDLARQLFESFSLFGDFAGQGEFGPDVNAAEPVLYQFKPFMQKGEADFRLGGTTQADMAFGICRDLKLPVVRIKDAFGVCADDFDTLDCDSHTRTMAKGLFQMSEGTRERFEYARDYQNIRARKARIDNKGDVCLAMPSYGYDDGVAFLNILEPAVVVISDKMRAGMIHNRTNLVQSVPVTIFGIDLYHHKSKKVKVSCDGVNAVVDEL